MTAPAIDTTTLQTAYDEHARVNHGIQFATHIQALARTGNIDAIHAITAGLPRQTLRQLIATLAAMTPDITPVAAIALAERRTS